MSKNGPLWEDGYLRITSPIKRGISVDDGCWQGGGRGAKRAKSWWHHLWKPPMFTGLSSRINSFGVHAPQTHEINFFDSSILCNGKISYQGLVTYLIFRFFDLKIKKLKTRFPAIFEKNAYLENQRFDGMWWITMKQRLVKPKICSFWTKNIAVVEVSTVRVCKIMKFRFFWKTSENKTFFGCSL